MKKLTVVIPCFNEEKGIGKVLDAIPKAKLKELGFQTEVLVIDNNSKDKTAIIAKQKGAKVIQEKQQGKGAAIKAGFRLLSKNTDYVVMLDGDNTYKPQEIPRLIEPLESNFADVIIGSRLEGRINHHSMSSSHRLANWFFTFIVRHFYQANVTDTCTGFFAWKKPVIDSLLPHIKSKGFAIESEMITKMAKLGYKIYSVPITYSPRHGQSKLSPIWDGLRITSMLIKNKKWSPQKQ
jgi:dolichol-phosphate mannosyltransferase